MSNGISPITNPVDMAGSMTFDGTWRTLDVTSYTNSGDTGVGVFVGCRATETVGLRHPDSTDAHLFTLGGTEYTMLWVKLKGTTTREIAYNLTAGTSDVSIFATVDANGGFNTNWVSSNPGADATWTTINPTSIATDPVVAFVFCIKTSGSPGVNVRKTGSTDSRTTDHSLGQTTRDGTCFIVGLDDPNRDFDIYEDLDSESDAYYVGDCAGSVTIHTNAVAVGTTATTGSWTNFDFNTTTQTSATADAVFIEIANIGGSNRQNHWREDGSTWDETGSGSSHNGDIQQDAAMHTAVGISGVTADVEYYQEDTAESHWVIGYGEPAAGGSTKRYSLSLTGVG